MRRRIVLLQLLAAALLFVAADRVLPAAAPDAVDTAAVRVAEEPLVAALAPLGPARALLTSVLWVAALRSRLDADVDGLLFVSEGLLALHPDLQRVRIHLASQLIADLAPRARDDGQHEALVLRGLGMLEEGLERHGTPELHGALGRLLVLQSRSDRRFPEVARRWSGHDPIDLAIDELRQAGPGSDASVDLADLLVDRALACFSRDGDLPGADRDLREAEALARALPGQDALDLAGRIADFRRELHDRPSGANGEPAPEPEPAQGEGPPR